jgi:pimeloyl-ACP methyl ester carboxylesterase
MVSSRALTVSVALVLFSACRPQRPPESPTIPPAKELAVANDAVDPDGTQFEYPYPVQFFSLDSKMPPLRMAYLDVAPAQPNGRTVLLLHGKNFSAAAWASTIKLLSERGYRVIAPDQVGFGKSEKPPSYQYSFAALAANTRALLAKLGIERSAVVGHSMGGMLATRYALQYPQQVDKLVLVNPIGLEDYGTLVPYRSVEAWYNDELKQTPDTVIAYQRNAYYAGEWKPEYEALASMQMRMTKHPEYARVAWSSALIYDMIVTQPVLYQFPLLKVPTGLIIGTRDRTAVGKAFAKPEVASTLGDYTQLGKRTRDAIPGAQLIEIEGAGHIPQVEAFDRYSDALLQLLQ